MKLAMLVTAIGLLAIMVAFMVVFAFASIFIDGPAKVVEILSER